MNNSVDVNQQSTNMTPLYMQSGHVASELVIGVLQDYFETIAVVTDAQDGFEKFNELEVDFIIADMDSQKNAMATLKEIRAADKDVPILILSSPSEFERLSHCFEIGVEDYLIKPINLERLSKALDKVVSKIRFKRELNNELFLLRQYQEITDHSAIVSKSDASGAITYVNDNFCKISEFTEAELIGHNHNVIRHPDNPYYIYQNIWDTIKNKKQVWKGTIRNLSKSGKIYYVASMIKPIMDANGEIVEYIALGNDITKVMSPRKQLEDFLYYAQEPILALIEVVDYNNLERFYGYSEISYVEKQISKKLLDFTPEDCVFKDIFILGNGRFAFAKDAMDLDVEKIIENVKFTLSEINGSNFQVNDNVYNLSVRASLAYGLNVFENCVFGLRQLEHSKEDFILANNLAHKQYQLAQANLDTLNMVNKAIENFRIVSYFQPIVDNETQKTIKYESLVRLINENGEILSPYLFLDVSKQGKFYFQITRIVLKNSFEALYKTDKEISINLSALDIEQEYVTNFIFDLLEEYKSNSHRIVFELLEDEHVKDMSVVENFIVRVKKYGVKIAIDDFGTGYSNFERLLHYQPDILKIDGSLIKNILIDEYSLSVVKTIIAFAKSQDIELVGEYVESKEIYELLKSLGVQYSQGYYFGKPDVLLEHNQKFLQ